MPDAGAAEQIKLKVFISYSRKDEEFAQDLLSGLEAAGFDPYLDKHDIAAGEDWEARLGGLIEAADAIVFVISSDAVSSKRCAWEVERAHELKKRLLPIVWRGVEEAQVPPRLKQLNYIFFDRPHSYGASLQALAKALKTDIEWVREHTRFGEAALRWDRRGRADALLFRGEELAAAKDWLKAQPKYAPEPTLLMHEFIKSGEDREAARSTIERQRLNQMTAAIEREKAAQGEREKALENEKAALRQAQVALRKVQRALFGVGILVVCVVVGITGWVNQRYLQEQYHWRIKMRPSVLTTEQEKDKAIKPASDFKECSNGCPTMIVVPAGKFMMGSPESDKDRSDNERPQHEVTIAKAFAVSKFEVTFDEWDACVSAGACLPASDEKFGRGDRPVIYVSWDDTKQYVAWLSRITGKNYRLLTEAEWEYAARARSPTVYSWGNEIGEGKANCAECGSKWDDKQTAPVGSFKPNAFGLYDMYGNVWEWVDDPWHDDYKDAPTDGSAWVKDGDTTRRVLRGGSWSSGRWLLVAAYRQGYASVFRFNSVGFRLARTLQGIKGS